MLGATADSFAASRFTAPKTRFHPPQKYVVDSFAETIAIGDLMGSRLPDVAVTTSFAGTPPGPSPNDYKLLIFPQRSDRSLGDPTILDAGRGTYMGFDIGDVNGDGDADVVHATDAGMELFEQGASGLKPGVPIDVENEPSGYPAQAQQVSIADVDRDGRKDLVVSSASEGLVLLRHTGTGFFARNISSKCPLSFDVGDVNGDHRLDVAAADGVILRVYKRHTDGSYGSLKLPPDDPGPSDVEIADVTDDGRPDVSAPITENNPGSHVDVYKQTRRHKLRRRPIDHWSYDVGWQVEAANMNHDGRGKDLVVLHSGYVALGVYAVLPGSEFAPEQLFGVHASPINPRGLAVGDINHDRWNDAVVADPYGVIWVMRQRPRRG